MFVDKYAVKLFVPDTIWKLYVGGGSNMEDAPKNLFVKSVAK